MPPAPSSLCCSNGILTFLNPTEANRHALDTFCLEETNYAAVYSGAVCQHTNWKVIHCEFKLKKRCSITTVQKIALWQAPSTPSSWSSLRCCPNWMGHPRTGSCSRRNQRSRFLLAPSTTSTTVKAAPSRPHNTLVRRTPSESKLAPSRSFARRAHNALLTLICTPSSMIGLRRVHLRSHHGRCACAQANARSHTINPCSWVASGSLRAVPDVSSGHGYCFRHSRSGKPRCAVGLLREAGARGGGGAARRPSKLHPRVRTTHLSAEPLLNLNWRSRSFARRAHNALLTLICTPSSMIGLRRVHLRSHHGRLRSSQRTIPHHQSLQLGRIGIASSGSGRIIVAWILFPSFPVGETAMRGWPSTRSRRTRWGRRSASERPIWILFEGGGAEDRRYSFSSSCLARHLKHWLTLRLSKLSVALARDQIIKSRSSHLTGYPYVLQPVCTSQSIFSPPTPRRQRRQRRQQRRRGWRRGGGGEVGRTPQVDARLQAHHHAVTHE
jgi:hypothetical protein